MTAGIQYWQVPSTGTYTIEVAGAAGGRGLTGSTRAGGNGATMSGTFSLTEGEVLAFLSVGLEGTSYGHKPGGGGGGTFVVDEDGTPGVAGGGGGGGQSECGRVSGGDGITAESASTTGTAGYGSNSVGGYASTGAGFYSNGISNQISAIAQSYQNGGAGADNNTSWAIRADGGFGGGGPEDFFWWRWDILVVTPMVRGLVLVEPTVEVPIMRVATKAIPVETTVDMAT